MPLEFEAALKLVSGKVKGSEGKWQSNLPYIIRYLKIQLVSLPRFYRPVGAPGKMSVPKSVDTDSSSSVGQKLPYGLVKAYISPAGLDEIYHIHLDQPAIRDRSAATLPQP